MPDRRYTYTVEIDASQARQAATQLRAMFERELAQIMAKPGAGTGSQPPDRAMQRTQQTAEATKKTLEQISKVNLSAPVENLFTQMGEAEQRLRQFRNEYEKIGLLAKAKNGPDARERSILQQNFTEVGRAAGPEAEAAARLMGRMTNIGQRSAEFKDDETGHWTEAARDQFSLGGDDRINKKRFLIAEQQAMASAESNMISAELDLIRLQKEVEQRRQKDLEGQIDALMAAAKPGDTGAEQEISQIGNEIARVDDSLADLTREETELLQRIEQVNAKAAQQAADYAAQIAREADVSAGRIHIPDADTTPGAATYGRQIALSVTKESAANADRLADNMERAAEAAERQQRALNNAALRDYDIDTARSKARAAEGERINAEKEIAATREASAAKIAITKAEASERVDINRASSRITVELTEQETVKMRGEEARKTAILKAELKEREAAAKAAARTQQTTAGGAGFASRPFGMSWGQLATGAAATLGIYGVDQVARGTFDAGREGAQQMRQMETFENLAQRVGVSSAAVVRAIRNASRETITSTNAMGLAAQVLSQKFAASSDDISGDLETLVKFSRRASQIYTDESGAFLSTQDVFARLIKFAREGNKELVDQFGLSNKAIADALGITVDGLASADGAAKRWQGMLMLLGEEMQRLGEGSVSVADQFEADTARIDEAWNRIKRNLAAPVSAVVTAAADITEGAAIKTGTADTDTIRRFVEQSNDAWSQIGKGSIKGFDELLVTLDKLDAASAKNAEGAKQYSDTLTVMGQSIINNNGATDTQIAQLAGISRHLDLVASGQDSYTKTMAATTMEAIGQKGELFQLAIAMANYEQMYADGTITLEVYTGVVEMLAGAMTHLTAEAGLAAGAVAAVSSAAGGLSNGRGGTIYPGAIMGPGAAASPSAFNAQQGRYAYDQDRIDAQTQRDATAREEKKRAEEAAARQTASAFESAAKKAQSAFEAAAQKTASEFKSALEKVPGLFGTSQVTAEDMEAAELGIYKNKADERLRVLADEVLNKKDTPEDPADWARRMGMDPGTDPRIVLAEARSQWDSGALFAGGRNLDLPDRAAINAALAADAAGKSGKEALLKEFGLGADSPLDAAGQSALKEMLGLGEEELTGAGSEARQAFDAGFYAPAAKGAASGEEGAGMAQTLADQLKTDIEAGEVADALYSIGGSIFGRIHAGFEDAASNADWSSTLIDSLAADVAPLVAEMIADQLPPKP